MYRYMICYTRRVPKKDRTFAIKTLFYNILSIVPFKVVPSTGVTPFRTFLLLLECFLERTFCDGAQFSYRIFLNLRVFKNGPNFLISSPTGTEGALCLLSAPSGRFWQQTAICPVSLWALVVELHPLNWARAQAVRLINWTQVYVYVITWTRDYYGAVAGTLWFISLGSLRSNWLPAFATDADMKQAVTFCWQNMTLVSSTPQWKPWCHAGTNAVISIATILKCDVYHLLPMCNVCFEVRIRFWISVCLLLLLSSI
jgi:hypothetical protein